MITSTCPCNRVEREAETRAIRMWLRTLRVTLDDINDACYNSAPSKEEVLGDAGLGKTTLVKFVNNNDRVQDHFDVKIWVSFSDCYPDGEKFTQQLIDCAIISLNEDERRQWKEKLRSMVKGKMKNLEYLQLKLSVLLLMKKFLLILDGVSNEICCEWHLLSTPLTMGANGSMVLVTTRSTAVSSVLGTVLPYSLGPLSYKNSLSLFIHTAFGNNQSDTLNTPSTTTTMSNCCLEMVKSFQGLFSVARAIGHRLRSNFVHKLKHDFIEQVDGFTSPLPPSELSRLCEELVKLCRGLPSIIVAFGILLRSSSSNRMKSKFLGRFEFYDKKIQISSSLLWTYHGFSSTHLKQCFVYCALFPKGYRFEKHKLVLLWMAEGFLQPECGMGMEDLGFAYFDELLEKSFLHIANGRFVYEDFPVYQMPDHVYDLAKFISSPGDGYFKWHDLEKRLSSSHKTFEYAHHSSLCCATVDDRSFEDLHKSKGLRTLLICMRHVDQHINSIPSDISLNLSQIRVLDLARVGLSEFPNSICHLSQLRFLDLSFNFIQYIPEGITMLKNLQTLRIKSEVTELKFPKDMGSLVNLRNLDLGIGYTPFVMPQGIAKIPNLQALGAFAVDEMYGRLEVLRGLVNLRGSLVVLKLENMWKCKVDSIKDCLIDKKWIHKLELVWNSWQSATFAADTLARLEPHKNLRYLVVYRYSGIKFPTWVSDPSFSNLETIRLDACTNCEFLPPLGQLPSLKSLHIDGPMQQLHQIDSEFCGKGMGKMKSFLSLRTLHLQSLSYLETWFGLEKGDMPRLQKLNICSCGKLISLPTLRFLGSLQELHIQSCRKLQKLPDKRLPRSVSSLIIVDCPILLESCKKKWGWSKIIKEVPSSDRLS
ncbi:putative disease resistance RPP13-like protein 1 isoform X2 [Papaver somniferum]|uniref:putative disease resistance RPP13-like protein 1 isoform X2 n=1 Tax=Papaver somniferum TaxID=3469 RepID=UPI000E6FD2A1|nr:putative disease resistance RPP13-like protein 1 isoform X2 [Papaver somniferum]